MVKFRWLGVAGIELEANGEILAIDPFFTRPPMRTLWFSRVPPDRNLIEQKLRKVNFLLVSHSHYDHIMDVPVVLEKTGALAFGSENTCQLLRLHGIGPTQIHKIESGDRLSLGEYQVEVLASQHYRIPGYGYGRLKKNLHLPLRLQEYRMDCSFSFLIQVNSLRILVWNSALAGSAPQAEVLFLNYNGTRTYLEKLLENVQPDLVVPVHWDDFFRPVSKPIRASFGLPRWAFPPVSRKNLTTFRQTVQELAPGAQTIIPEVFFQYQLYG